MEDLLTAKDCRQCSSSGQKGATELKPKSGCVLGAVQTTPRHRRLSMFKLPSQLVADSIAGAKGLIFLGRPKCAVGRYGFFKLLECCTQLLLSNAKLFIMVEECPCAEQLEAGLQCSTHPEKGKHATGKSLLPHIANIKLS